MPEDDLIGGQGEFDSFDDEETEEGGPEEVSDVHDDDDLGA